jgi:hypothetical protein
MIIIALIAGFLMHGHVVPVSVPGIAVECHVSVSYTGDATLSHCALVPYHPHHH